MAALDDVRSISQSALRMIGEAFAEDSPKPGSQIGVRYTPAEKIDFDLIYGRNLRGDNASWITVGMKLQF
jgi:hypothetical protein